MERCNQNWLKNGVSSYDTTVFPLHHQNPSPSNVIHNKCRTSLPKFWWLILLVLQLLP